MYSFQRLVDPRSTRTAREDMLGDDEVEANPRDTVEGEKTSVLWCLRICCSLTNCTVPHLHLPHTLTSRNTDPTDGLLQHHREDALGEELCP